jgi:ABC-2 type transport system ATP-binding protein
MTPHAIEAHGVGLTYGPTVAPDGVDLQVPRGSTLGVLGHNGAGKTSLIRVLTTSLRPDRGRVLVDGIDVVEHPALVRRSIGVTGQYAGLDDFLTTVENLTLMARLSGLRREARARVRDLVERFDLHPFASRRVGELSGGSRRRVDLAASLVASPKVLFLDEPTTGLDPAARQTVWDVVTELTAAGTTVVLTTQYLEEADRLADQLVVLSSGRVVARGAPSELKRLVGGKVVKATVALDRGDRLTLRPVTSSPSGDARTTLVVAVADDEAAADLIAQLHADTAGVTDLEVTSPSLDDVFLHLTQTGAAA